MNTPATALTKRVYDVRNMSVDVGPAMREMDTIRSVESITGPGFTIDEIRHDAAVVFFRIAGGVARHAPYYLTLRFDTETEPEQMIEVSVPIRVPA